MKIYIVVLLAFMCLSSECFAQKVTSYSGYTAVIDNGTLPVGAIKTFGELAGHKMDNGQMKSHNQGDIINKKVSPRFAVAKDDVSEGKKSWVEALTACVGYKEVDNTTNIWRVPTQRELMLIYQMKSELEAIPDFVPFSSYSSYWSLTENPSSYSWCVEFYSGKVGNSGEDDNHYVRCIRDL